MSRIQTSRSGVQVAPRHLSKPLVIAGGAALSTGLIVGGIALKQRHSGGIGTGGALAAGIMCAVTGAATLGLALITQHDAAKNTEHAEVYHNSDEETQSYRKTANGSFKLALRADDATRGMHHNMDTIQLSVQPHAMQFTQRELHVSPGMKNLELQNTDSSGAFHNIVVQGNGVDATSREVGFGDKTGVMVTLEAGKSYKFFCVAHQMFQMQGTIIVDQ